MYYINCVCAYILCMYIFIKVCSFMCIYFTYLSIYVYLYVE